MREDESLREELVTEVKAARSRFPKLPSWLFSVGVAFRNTSDLPPGINS